MASETKRYLRTVADLEEVRQEAAELSASCPRCGATGLSVREQVKQATRQMPAILLCFQGYCTRCQLSVPVDNPQMRMTAGGES